jgi:hypothetical protein
VSPSRALGFAEARDGSRGLILHPRIAVIRASLPSRLV